MPTYHKYDLIKEFLETQLGLYQKYDVDVYIYDSNEDGMCQNIIMKYMKIYKNLYYVHIDYTVHSNEKVYMIYQMYEMKEQYKYIWLLQDAYRITENELCSILDLVHKDYDIIALGCDDHCYVGNKEYDDIKEYFRDSTWRITSYGTCIVKVDSFFRDIDWNYYYNKYLQDDCINYSHIGLYFEQLIRISNPKMFFKHIEDDQFYWSALKKSSAWINDTFTMICEIWPNLINKLPPVYDIYKKQVILSLPINAGLFSYRNFVTLKKNHIFTYDVYKKYKGRWAEFTFLEEEFLKKLALSETDNEICDCETERIREFCNRFSKVYIYGMGKIGIEVAEKMNAANIPWEAFTVTYKEKEMMCCEHESIQFSTDLIKDNDTGVVMALNIKNYYEVIRKFNLHNYTNNFLIMY